MLTHQDHFVPFNPLVTPAHIVPEWYFLPFYAILRSITFDISIYLAVAGVAAGVLVYQYCWRKVPNPQVAAFKGLLIALAVIFGIPGFLLAFCKDIAALSGIIAHIPFGSFHLVEAKLGGVLAMFGSILLLAVLPWLDTHPVRSGRYRPWYRWTLIALVVDACILGYVGSQPAEQPFITIGQLATAYYLVFFLVIVPWLSNNEPVAKLPNSIHEAVLSEKH
jgi:quinol-cytochrome oxidoreductase complex cytochrome b subunit